MNFKFKMEVKKTEDVLVFTSEDTKYNFDDVLLFKFHTNLNLHSYS